MNKKMKLKGQMRTYMRGPFYLTLLMASMNIWMYVIDIKCGILMSLFVLIYLVIVSMLYFYNKPLILNELVNFASEYAQVQRKLLDQLTIPYALIDENGKVMWMNRTFCDIVSKEKAFNKSIAALFPEITKDLLLKIDEQQDVLIEYNARDYCAAIQKITMESAVFGLEEEKTEESDTGEYYRLYTLYLFDETDIHRYMRKNNEDKLVAGLVYIDNYDEALDSLEEVRRSLLVALIDRKINKYFSAVDGIVKKLEKDKYFIIFKNKYLNQLKNSRFSLLEEVKTVNIGNEMAVTISMGIGLNADSYVQNYTNARAAIDLALGRGGDQAVLKDSGNISYYGGKSKQIEKITRVKARVKAHALRELMESKDKVVVMGHTLGDVDSFGAAIGMYLAARSINRKVYIVINDITSSVRPFIEHFTHHMEMDEDIFLNSHEAVEIVDQNTVLVVVDVNKPSITECRQILDSTKTIVVLDHHRQGQEGIEAAVLSYIEPYASSTCEMVAEILQYFDDNIRISASEADCIYAGIMVDTDNFMTKTGVRTFEAAAFLRRSGADVTRVRKLFREDMETYKAKAEAVRNAQTYKKCYAISVCPAEGIESPTIACAQAANELLNIIGVKASFVMTEYGGKIYVSARSIDEVNVQVIMERMGGGGHLNSAGVQITDKSTGEVSRLIQEKIDEMIEEGELS